MNQALKWATDDFLEYWRNLEIDDEDSAPLTSYLETWLNEVPGSIVRFGGHYQTYLLMVLYIVDALIRNPRALDFVGEVDGKSKTVRRNVTGIFDVVETVCGDDVYVTDHFEEATFQVAVYEHRLNLLEGSV